MTNVINVRMRKIKNKWCLEPVTPIIKYAPLWLYDLCKELPNLITYNCLDDVYDALIDVG